MSRWSVQTKPGSPNSLTDFMSLVNCSRGVWLRSSTAELLERARCGFSVNQLPVLAVAIPSSSGEKRQIVALRRTPPESTASEACMRMS
ncbi:MAG: hypothetical protein BWX70_02313 [Verrucomicrobia bacterium ADurb.Bin070]|nr:MAG: hypothetical protein BWX70_02313 [Verrucomicrobia bacterium ADurb.Bin070]